MRCASARRRAGGIRCGARKGGQGAGRRDAGRAGRRLPPRGSAGRGRACDRQADSAFGHSTDFGLMRAAAPLANVLRYGTARAMPVDALKALLSSMSAEICAGLAHAAHGLDEAATSGLHQAMRAFDGAAPNPRRSLFPVELAQSTLARLADDPIASPFLKGFAVRRLHDRGTMPVEEVEAQATRSRSRLQRAFPMRAHGWKASSARHPSFWCTMHPCSAQSTAGSWRSMPMRS